MKNIFLLTFILSSINCDKDIAHSSLSIGFWNIENLFDLINDPDKRDEEFALNGKKMLLKKFIILRLKIRLRFSRIYLSMF